MECFNFNRFQSAQIKMILVYKKYIFCEELSSVLIPWLPIYPCVHAIRCPFLYICHPEKNLNLVIKLVIKIVETLWKHLSQRSTTHEMV